MARYGGRLVARNYKKIIFKIYQKSCRARVLVRGSAGDREYFESNTDGTDGTDCQEAGC